MIQEQSQEELVSALEEFIGQPGVPVRRESIEMLASRAEWKYVCKTETLCEENEVFDKMVFVADGIFRMSRVMNNKDHTIAFGVRGDPYLSVSTYLYGKPSLFSFNPVTDSKVVVIDNSHFREVVEKTDLIFWFNKVLLRQINAIENRCVWLSQQDTMSRYLRMAELRPEIVAYVPLKHLASYLGVTQSSFSRIRAQIVGKKSKK